MRRRPDNGEEMSGPSKNQSRRGLRSSGGYYSAPTDGYAETNNTMLEMQNNDRIDDLSDQVRASNLL